MQVYPGGVPEEQLRLIPSLLYLYSLSEIGQWHITSKDTVVTLLAPDGALENQTEVRVGWGVVGRRRSLILALLTPTLPAGHPAEVPGPQWHRHCCAARGHWGLSPLLDEPPADPGHPALRVPVSPSQSSGEPRSEFR